MESTYRQEQLSRWFLPSLLFHLLILFAFFMIEQEKSTQADIIFFDDYEKPTPPITAHQPPPPTQFIDQEVAFALNLPKSTTFGMTSLVSEETKLAGDPQSPTAQEQDAEPAPEKAEKTEETKSEPSKMKQPEISVAQKITQHEVIEGNTLPYKEKSPPQQPPAPPQQKKRPQSWGQAPHSSSPISKNMSLTKLAEGFLNYSKETHGSAIDINSKDLALGPTLQKIGWFLQNSFHLHNKPISLYQDVRTNTTLHLEIDGKGALLNCYLSPQTNVPALDRNLLRIAQGAAPFPPIPENVMRNKKTFCIRIPIEIDAKQGTHEYYFVFRG